MDALYTWIAERAREGSLPSFFEYPFLVRGLIAVLILAPLLGGLSHIVVARRLAFFSAAIGNAALTGLSIGLLLGEPLQAPYGGMFGFCLLSALGMVWVKRRASLPSDTLVGVFLALTLGLGICVLVAVSRSFNIHQIESVMFGSLLTVTDRDLVLLAGVGAIVALVLASHYNRLLLDSASPDLARANGGDTAWIDYLFVVLLTIAIVVSLKIVGALLVEAMVVVPAAASRNLARSVRGYFFGSIACATVAGVAGIAISTAWAVPTGGAVILGLSALFFLTLIAGGVRARVSAR